MPPSHRSSSAAAAGGVLCCQFDHQLRAADNGASPWLLQRDQYLSLLLVEGSSTSTTPNITTSVTSSTSGINSHSALLLAYVFHTCPSANHKRSIKR